MTDSNPKLGELGEEQSSSGRRSQPSTCPGLRPSEHWDSPEALRGELYTAERLAEHAVELSHSHGKPSMRATAGPLRQRFAAAKARIRQAYDILARDERSRRDPSPAEEWLLDNSHVVDDQIREIHEDLPWGYLVQLPRLSEGAMRGYPRVYGLCLDYLRHTDAHLDLGTLAGYVRAYQSVNDLTIGELWAVPIMLRLGLILTVGALASSEASARDRARADAFADRLLESAASLEGVRPSLLRLERDDSIASDAFLVQLLRRLREHDAPSAEVNDWIAAQCARKDTTPEELARKQHLRQAADQVSVGNAITSMRQIAALDWSKFFEQVSSVEALLGQDPSGAHKDSDDASRDRCRHAVEKIARRSGRSEAEVARTALEFARAEHARAADVARAHVGYYLVDAGRRELERRVGYRPSLSEWFTRPVLAEPSLFYLGTLALLTALFSFAVWRALSGSSSALLWTCVALALVPASEIALSLANALVISLLPPRLLPKLALEKGIPPSLTTLVVVPSLLESEATLQSLLEDLEVRSLANPEQNLYFGLLTDFTDADSAVREGDAELLALARAGIRQLNARYAGADEQRFWLFHRERVYNPVEGKYMGWERKRGKLEELNRLLRGADDTSFSVVSGPRALLRSVRYVITLDADTELPRDVARKLVGTLAHPLNQALVDPVQRRVVRGYGILQPRVGTLPTSSRKSRFARIFAGPPGIDPYTSAVSDVYQDLFGEGSFVGKGIYDVDAFRAVLRGRTPENTLLSHDLFEGNLARSALVTDIEVLDEQPGSYAVVASRQHRWTRGDWQLLPWLFPRVPSAQGSTENPFSTLGLWKFVDNLRRSLLAPTLFAFAMCCWLSRGTAALGSLAIALVFLSPLLCRALLDALRGGNRSQSRLSALGGDLRANSQQLVLGVAFLLDQALLSLDAIARTLFRLYGSRRSLLEWTTMSQASQRLGRLGGVEPRMWVAFGAGLVASLSLLWQKPESLPLALPALLLWVLAPFLARWLSKPEPLRDKARELTAPDRRLLRSVARKTWRFFDTFVGQEDHFLPPDNYQEDPRGVVAHRTSPTNVGLYLLSVVAARDFGFVSLGSLVSRLSATLSTIERLEKRNGHILNWYETTTLRPLEPQYVSTVDNGNLAGYLWTLREAASDLSQAPLLTASVIEAARDALHIALPHLGRGKSKNSELTRRVASLDRRLEQACERFGSDVPGDYALLVELSVAAGLLTTAEDARVLDAEGRYWLEQAQLGLEQARDELAQLAPFLKHLQAPPGLLSSAPLAGAWGELASELGRSLSLVGLSNLLRDVAPLLSDLGRRVNATGERDAERATSLEFLQELEQDIGQAQRAGSRAKEALMLVGARAGALGDGMDFRFLFDEERELFSIGYNVGSMRLDGSHYDLLASEARLASLLSVAKGDAPQEHWFRAGRPRTEVDGRGVLLSWSGSMFEYLMPLLVTRTHSDTLLDETYSSCVLAQRKYGAEKGVPWGISESAYNVMDLSMTYQYRAFGVPGLGLKAGLGEDLVVAPYATALALLVEPKAATQNLRALAKEGLEGPYGFYEAIDYTPAHLPPGRRSVIVKAYMAHHQGMTLVALDNVLHGMPMQRRFHNEPRIKASALLLEERLPTTAPLVEVRATQIAAPLPSEPEVYTAEHVGLAATGGQRVHLLGHGELSTLLTASGGGFTTWKNLDVSRFREDSSLEPGGIYVYVRDHTRGALWSAAHLPTLQTPDFYDAAFHIDRVAFHRRDATIETLTEIVVSPEHPAEVRRITLTNHGELDADIDITSYTELVLAPRVADMAHPAFSGMFVETEALPARGALLARRRPRSATEAPIWVVQVLSPESDGFSELEFDTSRPDFIGRGGSLSSPKAMAFGAELASNVGCVLDPALALRRRVKLPAGARARLTLTTAMASSREAALELVEIHATPHHAERTFGLAFADARVELKHLGITAAQSHRFQRLLSAVLFPLTALRATPEPGAVRGKGKSALWSQGISGDLPILVLRIDDADFAELCRELLLAHEFFRLNGVSVDLVLLNEEPSGYLLPMQDAVLDLVRGSPAQAHLDQRGGVFVRRTALLSDEDRVLLTCAGRVVLRASQGTLAQQLRKAALGARPWPQRLQPMRAPRTAARPSTAVRPELSFDNGLGGFSADGREYVMLLDRAHRTPAPWCNVMANPSFGSVVSEMGSGCTWYANSQRHRLTPWSNDATRDPSGEVLFLRDDEDGSSWSLTPAPAGGDARYVVRHGMGYTHFEHVRAELEQSLSVFVSSTDPVKFFRVRLVNRGSRARHLSLYGVVEWVLGGTREAARITTVTQWEPARRALFAANPWSVFPEHRGVFFATHSVASVTADREEWFGRFGSRERPAALERVGLSGHVGVGLDPCAALQVPLELSPGQAVELAFALGDAESGEHALALVERYSEIARVNQAFDELNAEWERTLGALSVRTPDPAFDLMSNRWLLYQALSCRIWARAGFYQSSGAYGYRDQVQDVLGLILSRPELARQHLLRAAARQFAEGDVQHWWHPETGEGIRSRCSDDLLWLPYATSQYVLATSDRSILEEAVPVLEERQLKPNEDDLFGSPPCSREGISLYEHCLRALSRGMSEGPHGLPCMRGGDWNDGMNRVGREGQGESVWLAWFLAKTLRDFSLVAKLQGDARRQVWCTQQAARLGEAIDAHAWDGAWYRRAFFDDGTPLGSSQSSECQIDAIAQSWAVIAGVGDEKRAAQALRSAEQRLVSEEQKLMLLLTPPFEHAEPDPGYIRSYPAGIRENGGQYTHGVLWTVLALCMQGEGDRAFQLMSLLNPVHHGSDPEAVARYRVEPYVVAADVYASAQHSGRGGWTWYTGSAAWMYRDMIEGILGLRKELGRLRIAPCIPRSWPGFSATYRYGSSELDIVVENRDGVSTGVVEVSVDDRPEPSGSVALVDDGRRRRVRVVLGRAAELGRRKVSGT